MTETIIATLDQMLLFETYILWFYFIIGAIFIFHIFNFVIFIIKKIIGQ